MIKWTEKHPFGAHLLNMLITILIVLVAIAFLVKQYGVKIEDVHKDMKVIKYIIFSIEPKEE